MSSSKGQCNAGECRSARIWSGSPQIDRLNENQSINVSEFNENNHDRKNKSLLVRPKRSSLSYYQEGDLEKTTSKLFTANFNHHDPQLCVCESCTCGRHLCNFKNVKPDMRKASIYNESFNKKAPLPNKINIAKEYEKLQGPHIAMESRHRKEFEAKPGDINERRRPEDLIKVGGPSQQLTSYSSGFPGYRGDNQYVKPTDKHTRADFPMMARSTYSNSFRDKPTAKPVKERIPDNLKSTNLWLGKSTYGNFFQQPNPEDYAPKVKNVEKLESSPNYSKQYETTYGHSFLKQEEPTVCPSKRILESKAKGVFNNSKDRFAENSDFKALNPSFHAISTSKHFYV